MRAYAHSCVSLCLYMKVDIKIEYVTDSFVLIYSGNGVYLSTPKTEKFSEDGENDRLRFGLSSMQGWRAAMEDAVSAL